MLEKSGRPIKCSCQRRCAQKLLVTWATPRYIKVQRGIGTVKCSDQLKLAQSPTTPVAKSRFSIKVGPGVARHCSKVLPQVQRHQRQNGSPHIIKSLAPASGICEGAGSSHLQSIGSDYRIANKDAQSGSAQQLFHSLQSPLPRTIPSHVIGALKPKVTSCSCASKL